MTKHKITCTEDADAYEAGWEAGCDGAATSAPPEYRGRSLALWRQGWTDGAASLGIRGEKAP